MVAEHHDVRIEIQQRCAQAGLGDSTLVAELEQALGPYLIARATSAAEMLTALLARNGPLYQSAIDTLSSELRRRYGNHFISGGPRPDPSSIGTQPTTATR
jgi:hypothetical protein